MVSRDLSWRGTGPNRPLTTSPPGLRTLAHKSQGKGLRNLKASRGSAPPGGQKLFKILFLYRKLYLASRWTISISVCIAFTRDFGSYWLVYINNIHYDWKCIFYLLKLFYYYKMTLCVRFDSKFISRSFSCCFCVWFFNGLYIEKADDNRSIVRTLSLISLGIIHTDCTMYSVHADGSRDRIDRLMRRTGNSWNVDMFSSN